MADYYTNFSVILPLTKEQQEYAVELVKQMAACRDDNQPLPADFPETLKAEVENWVFETKLSKDGLWLHSQYGGQDTACLFIQHLLQRFQFAPFVAFEWSHDCSQPRIDAFGGGAAYITGTEIKTITTSEWLAGQNREHLFSPDTHRCVKCGLHADDDAVENQPCVK